MAVMSPPRKSYQQDINLIVLGREVKTYHASGCAVIETMVEADGSDALLDE